MEESGLKRKLSPIYVWAIIVGLAVGWGAFVMPGNTFLKNGGTLGTSIAVMLAIAAMMILTVNYGFLMGKFPSAGGEVIYVKKAFGENIGFFCGWFLIGAYVSILVMNTSSITLIGRTVLGNSMQSGYHYSIAGFDVYFGEIIVPRMILIVLVMICLRGVKLAAKFQLAFVMILVCAVAFSFVAAMISPDGAFENFKPAFYPGGDVNLGMLAIFAMMPWAFVGFDSANQFSEEINFPIKKLGRIMAFSVPCIAALYIFLNLYAASIIPAGYESWVEYVDSIPNLSGLMSIPTFYAAYEALGNFGALVIFAAVFCGIFTGIIGGYLASSRLMYAMSRERMLGRYFGELNEHHVPANAMVVILIVALATSFMGRNVLSWMSNMLSVGSTVVFLLVSAAALKYAAKEKKAGIIITGLFGIAESIFILVFLLVSIDGIEGALTWHEYICLIVYFAIGLVIWIAVRHMRHGWNVNEKTKLKNMEKADESGIGRGWM